MQTIHQAVFFLLILAIICLNVLSDIKFWRLVVNHQYMAKVKELAEESSDLTALLGPHKMRVLNTVLYTLAACLPLIVIVAIYFQGKYFGSPRLNHTAVTLIIYQIVDIFFEFCAWPTQVFPHRRLTIPLLVTTSILSFISYALLLCLIYQGLTV